jgi:aryl carrier-like protein
VNPTDQILESILEEEDKEDDLEDLIDFGLDEF